MAGGNWEGVTWWGKDGVYPLYMSYEISPKNEGGRTPFAPGTAGNFIVAKRAKEVKGGWLLVDIGETDDLNGLFNIGDTSCPIHHHVSECESRKEILHLHVRKNDNGSDKRMEEVEDLRAVHPAVAGD